MADNVRNPRLVVLLCCRSAKTSNVTPYFTLCGRYPAGRGQRDGAGRYSAPTMWRWLPVRGAVS
jgi:hypothetical protein